MTDTSASQAVSSTFAMDVESMRELGKAHALAGKQCVPYELQDLDKALFAFTKNKPGMYSKLRGAFNRGWEAGYFELVSE